MKLSRLNSVVLKATLLGAVSATMLVACSSGSSPSSNRSSNPQNPNVIVTPAGEIIPAQAAAASQYDGAELDPYVALNQYGTWQSIGQERYFIPSGVEANWQPYQNGSWSFDDDRGWSFVSQDRWGWLTEHYGIWRHHHRHGWVWFPFADRHYEASVVTWFDQGEYVGWYPYSERYSRLYVNGFGFDDGFWAGGYRPVINLGFSTPNVFLGIVLVNRIDVTRPNILSCNCIIHDRNLIRNVAIAAHTDERIRQGLIGPIPGGVLAKSHDFIQRYAAVKAPVGRSQMITANGGAKIMQPFMPIGPRSGGVRTENHMRPSQQPAAPPTPSAPVAPATPRPTAPPSAVATPKPQANLGGLQPRPSAPSASPAPSFQKREESDTRRGEMHNPSMKTPSFSNYRADRPDQSDRAGAVKPADEKSAPSPIQFTRVPRPDNVSQSPSTDTSGSNRRGMDKK